jgi:hypothetical protein
MRENISCFSKQMTLSRTPLVATILPLQPFCQGTHLPWPIAQLRRNCEQVYKNGLALASGWPLFFEDFLGEYISADKHKGAGRASCIAE